MTADILTDIDALIAEQLDAGEPRTGFDYGDPTYPQCLWPGCWESWHGLAITARMHEMRWNDAFDEDYRYRDDDSEVICPGGDFTGPPKPRTLVQYSGQARSAADDLDLSFTFSALTSMFGDLAASVQRMYPSWQSIIASASMWQIPDDPFTVQLWNPALPVQWPHPTADGPADPDPILDRATRDNPRPRSLLDPDTEVVDETVWIDEGRGFERVSPQQDSAPTFTLSVAATLHPKGVHPLAPPEPLQFPRPFTYPRRTVALWGSDWTPRWSVTIGGSVAPTPPPRRLATLTPTYRCARPIHVEQSRPWVQERTFDRRGRRPKRGHKR